MIEELTPQVLMTSMTLLIVIGSLLTVLLSALLLWKYRRAVNHAMITAGNFFPAIQKGTPAESTYANHLHPKKGSGKKLSSQDLFRRAVRAPWHDGLLYAIAIFAAAMLFAAVAQQDYSFNLGLPGFFVGTWIYFWPIVLALPIIVPSSIKKSFMDSDVLRNLCLIRDLDEYGEEYPESACRGTRASSPFFSHPVKSGHAVDCRKRPTDNPYLIVF
jgi:hypothetical protein